MTKERKKEEKKVGSVSHEMETDIEISLKNVCVLKGKRQYRGKGGRHQKQKEGAHTSGGGRVLSGKSITPR